MEKKIVIKRVSVSGHDLLEVDTQTAIDTLKEAMVRQKRWVFGDGHLVTDPNEITAEFVEAAENLQIANTLVGGV